MRLKNDFLSRARILRYYINYLGLFYASKITDITDREEMKMGLRRARELVVLMAKEFQPYGATWAELKHKSGIKPTSYKRAFNFATERKWFVGGGKRGELYCLNPDGCWRDALGPVLTRRTESNSYPEIRSGGPDADRIRTLDPNSEIDSVVALASEAIRYVDQKKRN
jgi:hypothetical protein